MRGFSADIADVLDRASGYLPALTSLRFFAALWVVLYHLLAGGGSAGLRRVSGLGFQGVSLFFVLSGFVLAHNYDLSGRWSRKGIEAFQNARFARIYPAYVLGLVLMAPLTLSGLGTPETVVLAAVQLVFCLALAQAWIPPFALSWNSPGWSLSCEAFYYYLFPRIGPGLWSAARDVRRGLYLIAIVWAAGIAISAVPAWFGVAGYGDRNAYDADAALSPFWTHLFLYNPALRCGEFLIGILACRTVRLAQARDPQLRRRSDVLEVAALLGIVAGVALAAAIPASILSGGGLLAPFYALLIASLSMNASRLSRWLSNARLLELGECSYALYILHYPVAVWMVAAGAPAMGDWWPPLYLAVCVAASRIAHRFLERPARSWIRSRFERSRAPVRRVAPAA